MALSDAEKARRYRERQKAKKQAALKRPTPQSELFKKPFFECFTVEEQLSSQYVQSAELGGIQVPLIDDDSGPENSTLDDLKDPHEPSGASNPFGDNKGSSLGKAEVIIAMLLDSAADLAAEVSRYKREEIEARIAEIEASDLSEPEKRRKAFDRVADLKRMHDELAKETRWSLPVWKVDLPDVG